MTTTSIKRKKITLDASGQVVGRFASKIASMLIGKHKPGYAPHIDSGDKIIVTNIGELRFTGKKMEQKEYRHHSMHPGGLKTKLASKMVKEDPREILVHAVSKMLPRNKMQTARILRLTFKQ